MTPADPNEPTISATPQQGTVVPAHPEQLSGPGSVASAVVEPTVSAPDSSSAPSPVTPSCTVDDAGDEDLAVRTVDAGAGMSVVLRDTSSPMNVDGGPQEEASASPPPTPADTPSESSDGDGAAESGAGTTPISLRALLQRDTEIHLDTPPVTKSAVSATPISLRALLQRDTEIRRDTAPVPSFAKLTLPLPRAADIDAIEALYDSGGSKSAVSVAIAHARPYELPRARYVMTIDTGRAFERTNINKIANSFLKDNGNPVVQEQIQAVQLGQVSKGRGGEIRVKVKTRAACEALAQKEVKILGGKYKFSDFDILADRYYLDVSSVDSDFDDQLMVETFHDLGAQPIYATFRDVCLSAGLTTATSRVYFRVTRCPDALIVDGKVCEQIVFGCRVYPALGRDATFPSQRLGFGQRSPYALSLDAVRTTPAGDGAKKTYGQEGGGQKSYADVVKLGASPPSKRVPNDDAVSVLSLGTNSGSVMTPPGIPKGEAQQGVLIIHEPASGGSRSSKPLPLLTQGVSDVVQPSKACVKIAKGKRTRSADDFANMLQKGKPKPVSGIVTSNYFAVLGQVEVDFECQRAVVSDSTPVRFQIVPCKVGVPETVRKSTEAIHFLFKDHTSVKRTNQAIPIQEAVAELEDAEETSNLQLKPAQLAAADALVAGLRNMITASSKAPLAFNAALLAEMSETKEIVPEVAQMQLLNRVLSACHPSTTTNSDHKWAKYFGTKLPNTRKELFSAVADWWKDSALKPMLRATLALALFEVMLMCTAPQVFMNNVWIQRLTYHPVAWIPAHNCRLLHPNMLLSLLRSGLGTQCLEVWKTLQWQGSLLDDIEYLRDCELFFQADEAILQLKTADGGPVLVTGPLQFQC